MSRRAEEKQAQSAAAKRKPETMVRNGKVQSLSVDHDHQTGVVRGLLCARCNFTVGHIERDRERLDSALTYLAKFQTDTSVFGHGR